MSGLGICVALAVAIAILLRLSGVRGFFLALASAALVAGCLSFNAMSTNVSARVDRPAIAGRPPASLAADRYAFMGRFTASERWLGMADAIASRGNRCETRRNPGGCHISVIACVRQRELGAMPTG